MRPAVLFVSTIVLTSALVFAGCLGPPPRHSGPARLIMTLSIGSFEGLNATAIITTLTTSSLNAPELSYQVVAPNATIYFSGAAGTGAPVNGVVLSVIFNDAGGAGAGNVSLDDTIRISVAQSSDLTQIHGTTFKVLVERDVFGTTAVP